MQVIFTKVIPATNHKPSKVVATASGNWRRASVSVDAFPDVADAHKAALQLICRRLGWYFPFVGGHTKTGMVWVILADMSPRVTIPKPERTGLVVDGTSTVEFITDGEGVRVSMEGENDKNIGAPFLVFDIDRQDYVAGPFDTYAEAKAAMDGLKPVYEVIVGNIGTVHSGKNEDEARKHFAEYVSQSKAGYGRAGGEDVTLMRDGDPVEEFAGENGRAE